MAVSYEPCFLWIPTRLVTGQWAWLRKVRRVRKGGLIEYRYYSSMKEKK